MRNLELMFRMLGEAKKKERRRARRRRAARRAGIPAFAVLALAGGSIATGTNPFVSDQGQPSAGRGAPTDTQTGHARRGYALVDDPVGGPKWGVGITPGTRNPEDTCILAGRLVGDQLGNVQGGQFFGLSVKAPASCDDAEAIKASHIVFRTRNYHVGDRSILYGWVDRGVSAIQLAGNASDVSVPIASDGSFIAVRRGACAFRGSRMTLVGPPSPLSVPLSLECR